MSTTAKNRRGHTRHPIPPDAEASVEFESGGRSHRLKVLNLSASGLSFAFAAAAELHGLEEGEGLGEAVVRVGNCVLRGELLVMHVTGCADSGYVCGALFYPATDTDLVKLKSMITGMEVAGAD